MSDIKVIRRANDQDWEDFFYGLNARELEDHKKIQKLGGWIVTTGTYNGELKQILVTPSYHGTLTYDSYTYHPNTHYDSYTYHPNIHFMWKYVRAKDILEGSAIYDAIQKWELLHNLTPKTQQTFNDLINEL
jgi:hypothetical protein